VYAQQYRASKISLPARRCLLSVPRSHRRSTRSFVHASPPRSDSSSDDLTSPTVDSTDHTTAAAPSEPWLYFATTQRHQLGQVTRHLWTDGRIRSSASSTLRVHNHAHINTTSDVTISINGIIRFTIRYVNSYSYFQHVKQSRYYRVITLR